MMPFIVDQSFRLESHEDDRGRSRGRDGIRYNGGVKSTNPTVPLSAVVITLNAEKWLESVLRPLAMCNEILVLDSGSTDRTREIAGSFGAVWREHRFDGYGPQKRRAVEMARHDWILSIDADEVLGQETAQTIAATEWDREDPRKCWKIRRRPFVGRQEIRHGHWVPDPVVRLFNRKHNNFSAAPVHESVLPTGPIDTLPGAMDHHSYEDLAGLFRADYHRLKAAEYRRVGRRIPGTLNLSARAVWAFFYSLILKRGFLDGPAGVVIALSAAVNAVLALALAGESPSDS